MRPEQWKQIEHTVNDAEKAGKRAGRISRELYQTTQQPRSDRSIENAAGARKRKIDKGVQQEAQFEQEAEQLLGQQGSDERLLVDFRMNNLITALRAERDIEQRRRTLITEEVEILAATESAPSGLEVEVLADVRKDLQKLEKEHEEVLHQNPEAYFGLHLRELKKYKRDLETSRIVETPSVQRESEDIVAHLRAGKPVMLYGHLGSGKTELAMHIARTYVGKEALVISGSKNMSLAELYGHQVLAIDRIDRSELDTFIREVEDKFTAWKQTHTDASVDDQRLAHDRILQTYLTQLKSGTISDYFLGPIYRAMAEGRPVIIDEVNAIPHEVLISLNHILTRRVGETINVQQDSGKTVTVQEGFGIMMTGNLNQGQERYVERQDMDPAFLSRLYKVEHDYLPQTTEGTLEDEAGKRNELFALLVAKVMDRNGNMAAPKDTVRKLWNLAKAARITQNVFAGKEVDRAFYFKEGGTRSSKYYLQESVLSLRALDNVITQWQKEGYRYELDYYVWKEFVSQSTVAADKAYLYQILKDQFGFFQTNTWEQSPHYGTGGVVNAFDITVPTNPGAEMEFLGPREVIQAIYGQAPERTEWPEPQVVADAAPEPGEAPEERAEELIELEAFKETIGRDIAELSGLVEQMCGS